MKIDTWKDPKENKYYFAIKHKNTLLSAVMAEFYGPPGSIKLLIEAIKKGSEFIEKGDNDE